jgi:hypothetical protein
MVPATSSSCRGSLWRMPTAARAMPSALVSLASVSSGWSRSS